MARPSVAGAACPSIRERYAMLRWRVLLVAVLYLVGCSSSTSPVAPEEVTTELGPALKLSYVAKPTANGTRCMYDRPGLLYWSRIGLTATVLNKGQWEYFTYSWDYIGIKPEDGRVSYGINNGRITFPGDQWAVWTPQ